MIIAKICQEKLVLVLQNGEGLIILRNIVISRWIIILLIKNMIRLLYVLH